MFRALGYRHPALVKLYSEAGTSGVSRLTELHARRAIAESAAADDGFARQLDRIISDLQARERGTTISAQYGGAVGEVRADHGGTAIGINYGRWPAREFFAAESGGRRTVASGSD